MSQEEKNKAAIRHFFEVGNQQDMEAIWDCIDPHCNFSGLAKRFAIAPTLESYKKFLTAFYAAVPDAHFTIEDMVAEGEKVWVRINIQGTHRGLLRNIPATNKPVSYTQIGMYRLANGKIIEAQAQFDDLTLLRQMGAYPA